MEICGLMAWFMIPPAKEWRAGGSGAGPILALDAFMSTDSYLQRFSGGLRSRHLRWQPEHAALSVSESAISLS